MFRPLRAAVLAAVLSAVGAFAAPSLTTIQDVLYRADGSRFEGTIFIRWNSFASGATTVPTQSVTVQVVAGLLRVSLAPTDGGSNYKVRYNSQGKFQFEETWIVPASSTALKVRDVRVPDGAIVPPPPVIQPGATISDVTGLAAELAARPTRSPVWTPSRAATIDGTGSLSAASGDPADCVRVDGSSGPCGAAAVSTVRFADNETPAGAVNGTNAIFRLARTPTPGASLVVYRNGTKLDNGLQYSLSGDTIAFQSGSIPGTGDTLAASYRYADPSDPSGTLAAPQVLCSAAGASTSAGTDQTLASCTIPANLLKPGDRVEVRFDYAHNGATRPFTVQTKWGATAVVNRDGAATDDTLAGRVDATIQTSATQWNAVSWGSTSALGLGSGVGNAPDDLAAPLTVAFSARLNGAGTDTLALRSYTVVRYPAQGN